MVSVVRLGADSAISSTTKSNLAGMAFVLAPNTNYVFEFILRTTANAATVGVQFALTFGGTITRLDAHMTYFSAANTYDVLAVTGATTSPQNFNPINSQGNVVREYRLVGLIEVGATGGTLQLQHGSETATLTTVQRGSWGACSSL